MRLGAGQRRALSKRLSYHLRHDPAAAGVSLDPQGWVDLDALLDGLAASGRSVSRAEIEEVVERSDKRRFELSDDRRRIRARYGHSVDVDPQHAPRRPPDVLYHGTVDRALDGIRRHGLEPRSRQQVHLSADEESARQVGARRGKPVIVRVDAGRLADDGVTLRPATDGVWLVDRVPPDYLDIPASADGP